MPFASSFVRRVPLLRRTARWVYERIHARHGVRLPINGRWHNVSAKVARGIPSRIDAPALRFWLESTRGRDAALDAGANIGVWSILAAAEMAPGGRLLSVEPAPAAFDVLRDCARVLQAPGRIIPVCAALGDRGGTARLRVDSPLAPTNRITDEGVQGDSIDVPIVTIDALLAEHALRPSAIKVDVEGAELRVLRGAMSTLRDVRPLIALELHWVPTVDPRVLLELAREARYALHDQENCPVTSAEALLRHNFVIMRPEP